MSSQDPIVSSIIDDRLFTAYWDAVGHFKTRDLVLYYDETEEIDPVRAFTRKSITSNPNTPEDMKERLSKPADECAVNFKTNDGAFWLIVELSHEELTYVAVNAKFISPGGNA